MDATRQAAAPAGPTLPVRSAALLVFAALLAGLVTAAGLLLTRVLTPSPVSRLDERVIEWFVAQRTPTLNDATAIGAEFAMTLIVFAVTLVVALVLRLWLGRWRESFALIVCVLGEWILFRITNAAVGRQRPDPMLDRGALDRELPLRPRRHRRRLLRRARADRPAQRAAAEAGDRHRELLSRRGGDGGAHARVPGHALPDRRAGLVASRRDLGGDGRQRAAAEEKDQRRRRLSGSARRADGAIDQRVAGEPPKRRNPGIATPGEPGSRSPTGDDRVSWCHRFECESMPRRSPPVATRGTHESPLTRKFPPPTLTSAGYCVAVPGLLLWEERPIPHPPILRRVQSSACAGRRPYRVDSACRPPCDRAVTPRGPRVRGQRAVLPSCGTPVR